MAIFLDQLTLLKEKEPYLFIEKISHIVLRKTTANWFLKDIQHKESCVLVYCFEGYAEYILANGRLRVGPNQVAYFLPGESRSIVSDPLQPWTFCSTVFQLSKERGIDPEELRSLLGENPLSSTKEIGVRFRDLVIAWNSKFKGYSIVCNGILMELLGLLIHRATIHKLKYSMPHYSRIQIALEALEKTGTEAVSLEKIANKVGLSESRFRHLFKQAMGVSPHRYRLRRKIDKAIELLSSGLYNVSETAFELGFDNVYYFSNLFKSYTGRKPSSFLK